MNQVYLYKIRDGGKRRGNARLNPFMNQVYLYAGIKLLLWSSDTSS